MLSVATGFNPLAFICKPVAVKKLKLFFVYFSGPILLATAGVGVKEQIMVSWDVGHRKLSGPAQTLSYQEQGTVLVKDY